VGGEKCDDRRRHVAHAEIHRSGELDGAARHDGRALRFLLRFLEVRQQLHAALVESAPAFGEADTAGGAVQQPGLQMGLELGNVSRRCGSRQTQARCRRGKTS
jgi:hypothetical protein